MFGIGMTELMVVFVIGLVVLGPKRLPELARSLGKSMAEFRRASNEMRREFMSVADEARIEPPSLEPAHGAAPSAEGAKPDTDTKPEASSAPATGAKPSGSETTQTADG